MLFRSLKSLLQHHSSKASILRRSAFFTVQLSHPYTVQTQKAPRTCQEAQRQHQKGSCLSPPCDLMSSLAQVVPPCAGELLHLQHHITQSEGSGRKRAGPPAELHFVPRSLKVLCDYYWLGSVRQLQLGGHVVSTAWLALALLGWTPLACS